MVNTLYLSSQESGTVEETFGVSGVLEISVDPGGDRGSNSINPPIKSYTLSVEKLSSGSFKEVDGSPTFYSGVDEQFYIVGEKADTYRVTITNEGDSSGSVDISMDIRTDDIAVMLKGKSMKPREGQIEQIISRTGAVTDNNETFLDVQSAADSADDWVLVGPGHYYENVVVPGGIDIEGFSRDSVMVDGGSAGHAVESGGSNVELKHMGLRNEPGSGADHAVEVNIQDNYWYVKHNRIPEADNSCIHQNADGTTESNVQILLVIQNNVLAETDVRGPGVFTDGLRSIIRFNVVRGGLADGANGIAGFADNQVAIANEIYYPGKNGIVLGANNSRGIGNHVRQPDYDDAGIKGLDTHIFYIANTVRSVGPDGYGWQIQSSNSAVIGCSVLSFNGTNVVQSDTNTVGNTVD